jgi:hypothetical protein
MPLLICLAIIFAALGCAHQPVGVPPRLARLVPIQMDRPLFEKEKDRVQLGGLSGLFFSVRESTPDQWVYWAITDRGPNGQSKSSDAGEPNVRPFLAAKFSPMILKIVYDAKSKSSRVVKTMAIRKTDQALATGLPNVDPRKYKTNSDEIPVTSDGEPLPFDPWGIDPENVIVGDNGHFWLGEEYGPSLLELNAEGRILHRFLPTSLKNPRAGTAKLPAFLANRQGNRGFEALAWTKQKNIIVFLQSPVSGQSGYAPIIEFDPRGKKVLGLYFYPMDPRGEKIGDATLMSDGKIAVIEQNGKYGAKAWHRIFIVDFSKASNLLGEAQSAGLDFTLPKEFTAVSKTEALNLTNLGLSAYEKIEGLSLTPKGNFVLVNDNDFRVTESSARQESMLIFTGEE